MKTIPWIAGAAIVLLTSAVWAGPTDSDAVNNSQSASRQAESQDGGQTQENESPGVMGGIGAKLGSFFGDKAERQVDRQENHAEQRADWETDRKVDEKVGGFMDKIFGR